MRIQLKGAIAITLAAATLAACGGGRDDEGSDATADEPAATAAPDDAAPADSTASSDAPAAIEGFAADAVIGVALPDKTSENWVLAGGLFEAALAKAGFKGDVQYAGASSAVADQQNQIQAMVTNGAKVIVIGAKDGAQLGTQVEAAKAAGAYVIAYDRLILNTDAVDYYVAFDNFKVGVLQGQALLEGMKAVKPEGPYTIELFSGSPDDSNAGVFFNGAMSVLQPLIDSGELIVGSDQNEVTQTAIQGWTAENAQKRMDSLMTGTYTGDKVPDGVLSPNDNLARAIITSVEAAGKPIPVVTGQDSEVESVKSIMEGKQYSTINKDTRKIVAATIEMVKALQAGEAPTVTDTEQYNNGVKVVPANLLEPLIVTKDNAAEAYADDPTLGPIAKG